MDNLTEKQRSYCMSRIKSRDTKAEITFRKYIWKKGFRNYRMKNKIKGKPDLYFPRKKIAVFIDGCFWHKCPKCFIAPKSQKKYWNKKIRSNVLRDKTNNILLRKNKIKVVRFWQHDVEKNIQKCYQKFRKEYEKNI